MRISRTIAIALSLLAGTIVVYGLYVFLFLEIKEKNNQVSVLQNQLDLEVRKDSRLQSMKQLLADLSGELQRLDTYFVPADGVVAFLEDLESLGRSAGAPVDVNSVSVEGGMDAALPYELLRVEFVSRGSWTAITQLLALLEAFPAGITLQRTQLERMPSSSGWQANITFNVLKLK